MDKNKILDAAAKLVAKGAYDKAIKEYAKVLDADPKDVRVLQKLGELHEKKNDNPQAASYFTRVADGYANDGFSMKAIALYKKVLKLDPNLIDVNLKLAELHQQHQLMSEAMAYYQAVANHHDKGGNVRASLDILKKMVELEPDNVSSRIKLAELYAREKMNPEAAQEFKRAAEYLRRNSRIEDYLRVAERLSGLEPNNLELARELAQEYLNRGDQKRALARLQVCFKADPRDVPTLNLLAQAFQGLGQTSKTVSVFKELAKIHQDGGRADEANKLWAKVAQLDPNDPDLQARNPPRSAAPAPAAAPEHAHPAPAQPAQAHPAPAQPAQRPQAQPQAAAPAGGLSRDQLSKLLTETDVYVKYGLHDKALEHLRRIFAVDPENLDAHEKAYQIYVAANNTQAAPEQLLNVLRLCTRRQDVQRAQPYLAAILQQNPNHPEVPAFLHALRTDQSPVVAAAAPAEEPLPDDAILVDSSDEEIIVADAPEDALAADQDLALAAAHGDPVAEDVIEEPALEPVSGEFYAPAEELVTDEDEPLVADEPASAEIVVDEPALAEDEPATSEVQLGPALGDDEHEAPTNVRAVPAEAFRLAQGFRAAQEAAPAKLSAAPAAPRSHAREVTRSDARLVPPAPPPPAPELEPEPITGAFNAIADDQPAFDPPPDDGASWDAQPDQAAAYDSPAYEAVAEEPVEAPPEEEEPAAEECDEAQFFLDQGLFEEAREILETVLIAFSNHARAAQMMAQLEAAEAQAQQDSAPAPAPVEEAAPPQVDPVSEDAFADEAPAASGGLDAFDLAAELADELGDLGDSADAAPATGDDYQVSVDEVFSEFKKGLEKIVKPEDVETHYDLGIAYKEMGLMDDAIGEFSVARQGCVGKKKEIDCLTMIGLLHLMRGDGHNAVDAFKQALQSEHASADVSKALRFELATAWESAGSPGKALYHLQAVHQQDPRFRDVAENLQRLAAQASPEEDPLPQNGAPKNGHAGARPAAAAAAAGAQAAKPGAQKPGSKAGKVGYV